ncbi:MAG: type I-E CRISPR-associated protein Cas6/Cse3/CasE [Spirochaetia bacterium]|jgi:CRISPR system Cascade subunit CasE|nr:type I-E CRISPR-associated protein Cas6/Cse3/CasE [Spirochaetia bacterium]
MYISRVTLKRGHELFNLLKQKSGSDGYMAHQILWDLFPNDGNKKRDFLFHKDEKGGIPQFLLVSETKPVETGGVSVISKSYYPQLVKGLKLAFSLVANPVVSRKVEGKKHSVKHDVWMDAKKQAKENGGNAVSIVQTCENASKLWLIRQGERCGFSLKETDVLIDGYIQNRFYKGRKVKPIQYSSIHYEGLLTVTDTKAFIKMLHSGIGRSKAFGCGLLLVRRI